MKVMTCVVETSGIDLYLYIALINEIKKNSYFFLMFDFLMTLKALLFPHVVVLPSNLIVVCRWICWILLLLLDIFNIMFVQHKYLKG